MKKKTAEIKSTNVPKEKLSKASGGAHKKGDDNRFHVTHIGKLNVS